MANTGYVTANGIEYHYFRVGDQTLLLNAWEAGTRDEIPWEGTAHNDRLEEEMLEALAECNEGGK